MLQGIRQLNQMEARPHPGDGDSQTSTEFAKHVALRSLRRLAMGWLLNTGLSGFSALLRYNRRDGAVLDVLRRVLRNKTSVYLGLFVAIFGLIFQLSRRALRRVPALRDMLLTPQMQYAIAGSVAGVSIVALQPCVGTHLDPYALSLHSIVRAVQATARQDGTMRLSNHAGSFLFIAACTLLMYTWFYHPAALGRDYEQWITRMASMDQRLLDLLRALKEGRVRYGEHTTMLDGYCADHGLPREAGDLGSGPEPLPCVIVHPLDGLSCSRNVARRALRGAGAALSLYLPLHLISQLLVHRKEVAQAKTLDTRLRLLLGSVQRGTTAAFRSSAFLGAFIGLVWGGVCLSRNTLGRDLPSGPLLGSFLAGWSIFIENRDRRSELAAYVAPRALHAAWQRLQAHGWVRSVPGAHVAVFSAACAMLLYCYEAARQEALASRGVRDEAASVDVNPWRTPAAAAAMGEEAAPQSASCEAISPRGEGGPSLTSSSSRLRLQQDPKAAPSTPDLALGRRPGEERIGSEAAALRRATRPPPVTGDYGGTGSGVVGGSSPPLPPEDEDGSRGGPVAAGDADVDDRLTTDPAATSVMATPVPVKSEEPPAPPPRRRRYHQLPFSPFLASLIELLIN